MLVWIQLFVLLLLVALGFYVFVVAPRRRAHQTFAAFIAFLALWTIKDIILWNFHAPDESADWWAASSFVIALLMQFSLIVFAWVFPENNRTPRRKAAILFAPGIILIPAAVFGLLWYKAGFEQNRFRIDSAPLAYAFVVYVYGVFAYGAFILFCKYRKYSGTQKGQQIGAILWSLCFTAAFYTTSNIVFPFFGIYDFLPFSGLFALPGVLIYAYAITNFKLFSRESPLTQFRLFPISYKIALSIAGVAIFGFAVFQIPVVWVAFQNGMNADAWKKYLVFSVISALIPNLLLVLIVVRIILRPIQKVTTAAVQVKNGAYGTEIDLRETNDEIGLLADSFNEMSRKMASDIEHLKNLNEQLIRTEKLAAMGTLSAGVAHEVNNPLASISSLIQMMQSENPQDSETGEKLRLIAEQIRRISRVTKEMTVFAGTNTSQSIETDINCLLETSLRLAAFSGSFKDITVIKYFDENISEISANSDRLQQVFLNLFLNAGDAMPSGGELSIKTRQNETEVLIEISDTGSGIADEDLKRIFDPFFTTKPAGKGTGLGLAVCYGIITAHGGKIEAKSSGSKGTTFLISLPSDSSSISS